MKILQLQKGRNCADAVIIVNQTKNLDLEHDEQAVLYQQDAEDLFNILINSIPGGTYDTLCARLKAYWRKCEGD